MPHSFPAQHEIIRARERTSCATLTGKWGVDAIGRDYPRYLNRAGGEDIAGEWHVICNGVRRKATVSEARELNRAAAHGAHAIGPVHAAEASADVASAAGSARPRARA